MKLKGSMIFWELSEIQTTKDELAALGFSEFVPRNDFKAACLRALKVVTKGNEKLYRRHSETSDAVCFTVFGEVGNNIEFELQKEMSVTLDKRSGELTLMSDGTTVFDRLKEHYIAAQKTIDTTQLRTLILRIVERDCHGVSMRARGGIYFIDQAFEDTLVKVKVLFNAFPTAVLHSVPIYDDQGTLDAIEHAASEDIFGDIETLIERVKAQAQSGNITQRQLAGDRERADEIAAKMKVHYENLRGQAEKVKGKLDLTIGAIESIFDQVKAGIVEPEDFMDMLAKI